jgi:penicillin-binding protein 1C
VFTEETAALVGDILADPDARRLEFAGGGLLELPAPTAVKTGTSTDYRDAWALGFSHRHTVGVWMGNLDRREMRGVSGSIGPALVLRAIFAELARQTEPRALYLSRKLRRVAICRASGNAAQRDCPRIEEWFREADLPLAPCALHGAAPIAHDGGSRQARWIQPTPGLHLALDPRIPDELEAFAFRVETAEAPTGIDWFLDETLAASTPAGARQFVWPLARGSHVARARVYFAGAAEASWTDDVRFLVK